MGAVAVYKISNSANAKLYFGLSAYPVARWSTHKRRANDGYVSKLYSAMNKYGIDAFTFTIIRWCDDRDDANDLEKFLIEEYETYTTKGYNIRSGGDTGAHSEETKIKIGLLGLGREVTQETRDKIRKAHIGKKKNPMPDEVKAKLSSIFKGAKHSLEAIEKIRAASLGRKYPSRKQQSAEARAKAAETLSKTRTANAKRVLCVETNEIFLSARLAAIACGVSEATVSNHCRGRVGLKPGGKTPKFTFRHI